MSNFPEVFISSAHYGLEDLRGALQQDLTAFGIKTMLSSESGFPVRQSHLPPYAQCIKVLEECALVVGIIDKRYGTTFKTWGNYRAYAGLSPTHGELRHAIKKKIPINIFVRKSLWTHYESYRESKLKGPTFKPNKGYDLKSFEMLEEIKMAKPAPWIEQFDDVSDINKALRSRLLGYISDGLALQHKLNERRVASFRKALLSLDSKTRKALEHTIKNNPGALQLMSAGKNQKPTKPTIPIPANTPRRAVSNSTDRALAVLDITSALIRLWKPGK